MRRLAPFLLLAFLVAPSASADGCPPSTCATTASAVPGSPLIVQRTGGPHAALLAFDAARGTQRFSLPAGTLSPDGGVFYTAGPGGHRTYIRRHDPANGARGPLWSIRGRWGLVAVSLGGRKLALARAAVRRGGSTPIAVVDTRTHHVRGIALRGSYEVEALSPDGRRIFLIHHPWRSAEYDLRVYDVATGRLRATRLADPDEQMQGLAWNAVQTRDGRWLVTLYLEPTGGAFVHALDLGRGIAHCIDLPAGSGNAAPAYATTALVLSPDERTLYAVDPVAGSANVVDLRRPRLVRSVAFRAIQPRSLVSGTGPVGAVSPDGRMLYVAFGPSAFSYDTAYGIVRGPILVARGHAPSPVAGLGFAGRHVTALLADGGVAKLDAATGRVLSTPPPRVAELRELPGWHLVQPRPDVLQARGRGATITLSRYHSPAKLAKWRANFPPLRRPLAIRARDFGSFEGSRADHAVARRTFRAARRYYNLEVEFTRRRVPARAVRDVNRVLATFRP